MASLIHFVAHGLSADDAFQFANLEPADAGPVEGDTYYVLAAGLTADDFEFSETPSGTPFDLSFDITSVNLVFPDQYTASAGVMAPPDPVPTPSAPSVASITIGGVVRLSIILNDTAEAKVREWQIQMTHKFDIPDPVNFPDVGDWDWTKAQNITLPFGADSISIPALGSTTYATRVRAIDVYGNESSYSTEVEVTTDAGNDSVAAALADVANDISFQITETQIADDAISTPKLQANSVTADVLAAVLTISSLIRTAASGGRVELDIDGIRLYGSDESLTVRIPTDGSTAYFRGEIAAANLTNDGLTSLADNVALTGDAIMTLANGVSAPTVAPTVVASLDSITLGITPAGSTAGIGYDSGAGTIWVAADPSTGYVAHEYNATTGAYVRSIEATGSTTTYTTTLGSTAHVADTAQSSSGSTNSQVASVLTMPRDGTITKVAAYFAGYGGSCTYKMALWSATTGNLLNESNAGTATSAAFAAGNSSKYERSLLTTRFVASGASVWAGFLRTSSGDGFQWDRDDGAGKTTKRDDHLDGNMSDPSTDTSTKPNVYVTYTYDVDTRLETAAMIGVATDGTYVYTLDTDGVVWKYNRSTKAYVANSAVQTAISGTKTKAGMFYDATAGELIITTTTGTGAGVYPKFVRVNTSTLAVSSTVYSAAAGTTFSGTTDTFRGGARVGSTYWVATTSKVYAYTFSGTTATQTADSDFGQSTTVGDGIAYDGTVFRGWDSASPTKLWTFTTWDWTTDSAIYWCAYAWYDDAATIVTGGTAAAATNLVTKASHGLSIGDKVQFTTLTGGTGLSLATDYYVIASGFTTGVFKVSTTSGGSEVDITVDYSAVSFRTIYETAISPRTSLTLRRRERVTVQTPAIPTGGASDPNKVRIYFKPNATDPGAGALKLQVSDALTSRLFTTYLTSGAADGQGTAFPSGSPAQIKDAGGKWILKGDGTVTFDTTVTPGGKPPVVNVYTAGSGNWTKPAGISHIVVEVQGGGGAGGGAAASTAGNAAFGGGGGAGGYCRKVFTAANLSGASSFAYVAGASVAGGTGAGTSGNNSTFSGTGISTITGSGGTGGGTQANGSVGITARGSGGGAASGGDINVPGGPGGHGTRHASGLAAGGNGGNAVIGTGGIAAAATGGGTQGAGVAGTDYGGGGGGAHSTGGGTSASGGAGAQGVVIVTEYYGS